jgi:signal transduction histidine kinase
MSILKNIVFVFLTVFILFSHNSHAQDELEVEFKEIRSEIQRLSNFDSVSFFKLSSRAMRIAKELNSVSKQADVLQVIGTFYYFKRDIEKAQKYFRNAQLLAEQEDDDKLYNLIEAKKAFMLIERAEIDSAKLLLKKLERESYILKDSLTLIIIYNAKGQMFEQKGNYVDALKSFYAGRNLAEKKRDLFYAIMFHNNIGSLYTSMGKYTEALNEYRSGLLLADSLKDMTLFVQLNHNIGVTYISQRKYKEAEKAYLNNIIKVKGLGFPREIALSYLNLSNIYLNLDKKNLAVAYSDSALFICKENKLITEFIECSFNKAGIALKSNKPDEALKSIHKMDSMIIKSGNEIFLPNYYRTLSSIYEQKLDFKNALSSFRQFEFIKDSISSLTNQKSLSELQIKHDLERKEMALSKSNARLIILEKENDYKRLLVFFLIALFLSIVLGVIALSIYLVSSNKRRSKDNYTKLLINEIDEERSRIAKDLHDDIGQGLSLVKTRLTILSAVKDKSEAIEVLNGVIERMRSISRTIHPSSLKMIGLNATLKQLINTTEKNTGVICSFESIEEIENLDMEIKTNIYRIFQECINNTLKHANATALRIDIEREASKYVFSYRDNGVGMSKSDMLGMGLLNMKERAKIIKSNLTIESNVDQKGTLIKFDCVI